MIRLLTAAAVAAALTSPMMATAAGNGHGPAAHQPNGCPPGLAKKSPACVPPGQTNSGRANKTAPQDTTFIYAPGDRITRNYIVLDNPAHYGLNPDGAYYRVGDQVYQIDRHTKEVLDVIGAIAALAN
ncbi:excinuclease ABC subunit A [Sagittula sp. S175]|uniref:excinuclease ABC subunit A n=1 Tax=Sagittula sp. S175 TaxID=3415129 RepID=UPI003C7AA436